MAMWVASASSTSKSTYSTSNQWRRSSSSVTGVVPVVVLFGPATVTAVSGWSSVASTCRSSRRASGQAGKRTSTVKGRYWPATSTLRRRTILRSLRSPSPATASSSSSTSYSPRGVIGVTVVFSFSRWVGSSEITSCRFSHQANSGVSQAHALHRTQALRTGSTSISSRRKSSAVVGLTVRIRRAG